MEQPSVPPTTKICSSCHAAPVKAKICSQCKRHYFCNRECQKKYWKVHKRLCAWTKQHGKNDTNTNNSNTTKDDSSLILLVERPENTYVKGLVVGYPCANGGKFNIAIIHDDDDNDGGAGSSSRQEEWLIHESCLHPQTILYEELTREWKKGVKVFNAMATANDFLKSMKYFESSMAKFLPLMLANSQQSEEYACKSLFLGYCWSDYNQVEKAITNVKETIKYGKSTTTINDAYLELVMLYEDRFDMLSARKVAKESIESTINTTTAGLGRSIWKHPMQRPGQMAASIQHSTPWWNPNDFHFVSILEQNADVILQEFLHIRDTDVANVQQGKTANSTMHDVGDHTLRDTEDSKVVDGKGWRETVLFGVNARPDLAPKTCALLQECCPDEAISLCEMGGGEIIFSYLFGQTVIKPHCAATNHRLTCHLGLIVPAIHQPQQQQCCIKVCGEERQWEVGKCLIFDDSYEHEVFNTTLAPRGILLIRFWHPELHSDALRQAAYREAMKERTRQHERRYNTC